MKSITLIFFALLLTARSVFADTVAFTESVFETRAGAVGVVGFNFTVTTAINVTQLGFYGDQMGGLDTPWVALYDTANTATPLASITTYAPTNGWQYISLGSPVTLTVGNTYRIAATAYWTPEYASVSGFTFGSQVTPVSFSAGTGWGGWGTPVFGGTTVDGTPNIAGNFQYTVAAVPEPSTYAALVGLGALGLAFHRRRRA